MHRTQRRPLPSGSVSPRAALVFGLVLAVASIALLAATTTLLAAALAAGAIFYYAVLYTMVLKRHTRRSTEFGGVPGAAPVLIGWAAVTGSLDWPAVVFFGVVFCWQMPHFWALAMRFRDDYARAGVPMLPVVAPALVGGPADRRLGLGHRRGLAAAVAAVAGYGIGWVYTASAAACWGAGSCSRRTGCSAASGATRDDQADEAVPRLDLVPGAAVGRDHRRRPDLTLPRLRRVGLAQLPPDAPTGERPRYGGERRATEPQCPAARRPGSR